MKNQNLLSRAANAWCKNLAGPRSAALFSALLAIWLVPCVANAQTLTWDPTSSASGGTDGTGAWSTSGNYWYGTTDGPWASGDNAIIGSGGALTGATYNSSGLLVAGTNTITMGPSITVGGSITFGTTTGAGYSILDNSGTNSAAPSDPLVLSNSLTALTITDNNASYVTGISPSIQAANPFTLNIAGSGTLGLGGTIGTVSNPATLKTSGYTSDVFLDGKNNLASTTVSSGATVSVTNSTTSGGSLGPSTAGVTLAGGTLQLIQGAIGVNNSTSEPATSGAASGYYNPITGTNATGAYSVSNWNNFQTGGKTTNFAVQLPSAYGTALLDNIGVPTTASVTKVTGNNGYSMKSGADPSSALSGNQQMLSSGPNSSGTGTGLSTMQISNIPYASYSVYAYVFNNNVTTANYASLASSSTSYYFSLGATGSNSTANPSPILLPIASTSSTAPTPDVEDSSSQYEGMYAVWSGQTTSSATVSVYANGSGNPWLAGVEIVAAPVNIANTVSVTSSSTIKLGSYVNVPTISGALNVESGSTLSFTTNNSLSSLAVTGTTTFSGAQGTLSIPTGFTLQLGNLADSGNGFKTSATGTFILTADSSSTLSGALSINSAWQLSMPTTSSNTASATGSGALTIASGGSLTVPLGTLSGYTGLQNNPSVVATQTIYTYTGVGVISPSSTTVSTGGSITGPAATGSLRINSPLTVNGSVTAGAGSFTVTGLTTVSGGTVNIGANGTSLETMTSSGGLTLAGGTVNYTLPSASASGVSGINAESSTNVPSLSVTGSNTINVNFGANTIPIVSSVYDLIEYTASSPLATSGGTGAVGSGTALTFTGTGGTIAFTSTGTGAIPSNYTYTLVDNVAAPGTNEWYVQLQLAPPALYWTGATNGTWDTTTANWAQSGSATTFVNNAVPTFNDTNPLNGNPITNYNITIASPGVSPSAMIFNNNTVNYTFSGSPISGVASGLIMNGAASVTLASSNSFTGPVSVNAGQLNLQMSGALGSSSGVTVSSGAALTLQGGTSIGSIPLTINGTGWATNPAGALDSISGANSYAGAIMLAGNSVINSANPGDTLTLSGGIAAGADTLSFTGGGNITIGTTGISGSNTISYNGTGTLALAAVDTFSGPLNVNSGTLSLQISGALGTSSGVNAAAGGTVNLQNGVTTNNVPLTFGAIPNGGTPGALTSTSGSNIYSGAINLNGNATVTTSGASSLLLGGAISTGSSTLTFNGGGAATVAAPVSGNGGIAYSGSNTLTLTGSNSSAGGVTINSGTVYGAPYFLGNSVTLNGGTLGYSASAIGLNVATNASATGAAITVPTGTTAGLIPISNWNNMAVVHSSSTPISPGKTGDTALPFVLTNNLGQSTATSVVAWTANNGYSVVPTANSGDSDLLSSGLNTSTTTAATITISNIPYTSYSVYVYYWNNTSPAEGSMGLASGASASSLTANSTTYYFDAGGASTPTSYVLAGTTAGTYTPGADYAVWNSVSGSTLKVTDTLIANGTAWIAGVEIVDTPPASVTPVNVTANSTIDVTGTTGYTLGSLNIGANTLSVTGGSTGSNTAYTLTLGTVALGGNATFNVSNNGSATGTLRLGTINDSGAGYSINVVGQGTVYLTSASGNSYGGGTTISNGTLQLGDMTGYPTSSATGNQQVTINGGTLAGPTNINGNAYITGPVVANYSGAVQGTSGAALYLNGGLTLKNGSAAAFSFTTATPNGTSAPALIATTGGSGSTSLAIGQTMGDTIYVNLSGTPDANGTVAGTQYEYNLISYTGTQLSITSPNDATSLTFSNGATLSIGSTPIGPYSGYELVNNPGQIDLTYIASAESWTNEYSTWTTASSFGASQAWSVGASPTATLVGYVNTAGVIFGDTNNSNGNPVGSPDVTVQQGGVLPGSVIFTNNNGTYTFSNAYNSTTGADDTVGIAGSTGIVINGSGGVIFNDPNSFTGAIQINAGYLQAVQPASLGNSSGISVASGASLQIGSTSNSGNLATFGMTANGASVIPLTIGSTPSSSNAVLSSQGGYNTFVSPITMQGPITINSNSTSTGDGLIVAGNISTGGNALTFNGPGPTTVSGAISGGGGSVATTGGTLTLAGNNSFGGGLSVSAGGTVVVASGEALGASTNPVTLAGGALNFTQGSAIGVNIAASLSNPVTNPPAAGSYSVASLSAGQAAGVVPAYNWNNLTVVRNASGATNIGSPAPSGGDTPAGSTTSPFALTDSSGASSGASVTAWSGGNGYSVPSPAANTVNYGTNQILSSFINNNNNSGTASITVSNIPYSNYSVYLYLYSNSTSYEVATVSTSGTPYYLATPGTGLTPSTLVAANQTTYQGSTGNSSTIYYTVSDYAEWTNQTGSSLTALLTQAAVASNNSGGIAGIEIVNDAPVYTNPVSVTANSTVNVTGPSSVTVGTLSIGSNSLSVSGGSTGPGIPYTFTTGAVSLSGSPTFNVAYNSSGLGTLVLGAISDTGSNDGVTINGDGQSTGTVVFAGGGSYNGPTTVTGGTLQLLKSLTGNGSGGVTVANGATLSGPSTASSTVAIPGAVSLSGTIAATSGAPLSLTGGLTLNSNSSSSFTLGTPNGVGGTALIATSGGNAGSGGSSLTIAGNHTINLAGSPEDVPPGTYSYELFSYTGAPLQVGQGDSNTGASLFFPTGTVALSNQLPAGPYTFSLSNNPGASSNGEIDLQVTAYGLTYTGSAAGGVGSWDTTNNTSNWQYNPGSVQNSVFASGTTVTFADKNAGGTAVTANTADNLVTVNVQSTGVTPGAVVFTNVGAANSGGVDYAISGGPIGGATTTVAANGGGNVTLASQNTYGGGTTVSAGTLIASQPGSLGTGAVTLSGGTLRLGTSVQGFQGTTGTSTSPNWTINSNTTTGTGTNGFGNASPAFSAGANTLRLTDGYANEARTAFYNTPVPVGAGSTGFTTSFTYTPVNGTTPANGMVFLLQSSSSGLASLGANGGSMAISGITPSVGFEINLYPSYDPSPAADGGVAWLADGATLPFTSGTQYTSASPVNFSTTGDSYNVTLNYNPSDTTLTATIYDTVNKTTLTYTNNTLNVAGILGASSAYMGFAGSTGGSTTAQSVSNFSYSVLGAYTNGVVLTSAVASNIDVAANASGYQTSIGPVTVGTVAGSAATLNVTAMTAPSGQAYYLTTGAVTLDANGTFNVANAGTGTGALSLGAISDGGHNYSVTVGGPGIVQLESATSGSYTGGTKVTGGTLLAGISSAPMGAGPVTLSGGNLTLIGAAGSPGLSGSYYQSATNLPTVDSNLLSLNAIQSHFGSLTPNVTAQTTTGGLTSLNFPSSSSGNLFASQGFNGTDEFEAVLTGELTVTQAGSYTFETGSDDGSTLFIDGQLVVSNDNAQAYKVVTGNAVTLGPGLHSIEIGYFQQVGGAQLTVGYDGPDTGNVMETAIPDSVLSTLNSSQTYGNNVSVASNSTLSVSGSLAATVGDLSIANGTTLSVTSPDLTGSAYSLTFAGTMRTVNVAGTVGINVANSAGGGAGTVNIGSLVSTGATPTLQINPTTSNTGTVRSSLAPNLANNTSLVVNAGTLAFNVTSGSATIGTNVTVTVAPAATLQLAGSVSALSSSANAAAINNNGNLTVVGPQANQTVGAVTGTSGADVNGATIYGGNTTVGDGTNAANLSATKILQNSLIVNADSIVTIEPAGGSVNGVVAADDSQPASVVSSAVLPLATASSSDASSGSSDPSTSSDAFTSIEAALATNSTLHSTLVALRGLANNDLGLTLTPADDAALFHDYQLSAGNASLLASGATPITSASLLRDLTADGLSSSEIASLVGSSSSSTDSIGANAIGSGSIGSSLLSSSLSIGGSSSGPAAVPEPSALVLAALGLGVCGFGLRRRKIA